MVAVASETCTPKEHGPAPHTFPQSNALPHQTPAISSDTVPTRAADAEGFSSSSHRNRSWARFYFLLVTWRMLWGQGAPYLCCLCTACSSHRVLWSPNHSNHCFFGNFIHLHGHGAKLTDFCSLFSWISNEKLPKHSKLFECTHSLCQSTTRISNALIRLEDQTWVTWWHLGVALPSVSSEKCPSLETAFP